MTPEQRLMFNLIRLALGGTGNTDSGSVDQEAFIELCSAHGVMPIVFAGLERLNKERGVKLFSTEATLRMYATTERQKKAMEQKRQLSHEFLERMRLPSIVLKGMDYSRFWPVAEWRLFGDLDICPVGGYHLYNERAREIGCRLEDYGYYKHSNILYKGLMIENHQYLTTFDDTKTGRELELALQELVKDSSNEFRAIFIVVHAHQHFFWEGFSLKMLLDWHFFLEKEGKNTDWRKAVAIMKKARLDGFCYYMTAFCVAHLGLGSYHIPTELAGYKKISTKELSDFTEALFAKPTGKGKFRQLAKRFQRMWHFRSILGESVFTRIKNTLIYNRLHKEPSLA